MSSSLQPAHQEPERAKKEAESGDLPIQPEYIEQHGKKHERQDDCVFHCGFVLFEEFSRDLPLEEIRQQHHSQICDEIEPQAGGKYTQEAFICQKSQLVREHVHVKAFFKPAVVSFIELPDVFHDHVWIGAQHRLSAKHQPRSGQYIQNTEANEKPLLRNPFQKPACIDQNGCKCSCFRNDQQ